MQTIEKRVDRLEVRVDQLEAHTQRAVDVAVAAQEAHHQNMELLKALRTTQAEHSQKLDEHGRRLDEHSRKLDEHTEMLKALRTTQAEHGRRLDEHTKRLERIEGSLGVLTAGVHHIEQMLTRYIADQGGMN